MNNLDLYIRTERRLNMAFNSVIILLILSVLFYLIQQCDAEEAHADDLTALRLVQCIRAECDSCSKNPDEPAAIAHVILKRMTQYNDNPSWSNGYAYNIPKTLSYDEYIIAYCSVFDHRSSLYYSDRATKILESTFMRPLHGKPAWWGRMQQWANKFLQGEIPDPLPRAMHWGGDMDIARAKRAGWTRIAGPPEYSNTFWGDL